MWQTQWIININYYKCNRKLKKKYISQKPEGLERHV